MIAPLVLVRGTYGAALCLTPGPLIRLAGGAADPRAEVVARVLGARHVAQALALAGRPGPGRLVLSGGVDMLHAASMIALGAADRPRRRIALTDGFLAAVFAADGWFRARASVDGRWLTD